jgi:hypothetical protein
VAALAIPILVPFGSLFNNVTLGFTCHPSYLHTYIQPNNADCRRVTFAQDLKNCFCTDVRYPTSSSRGLPASGSLFLSTLSHDYVLGLFSSFDLNNWGFYFNIITITSWLICVGSTYVRKSSRWRSLTTTCRCHDGRNLLPYVSTIIDWSY